MACDLSVKEEFLALCRAVEGRERASLTFFQSDGERNFALTVGYGYFSGALLTVEELDQQGETKEHNQIDRPLEVAVERFLSMTPIGPNEPWALPQ